MDGQKQNTSLLESGTRRKQSKLVQVVQNFFTKTLQVIVHARSVPESKLLPYEGAAAAENSATSKINKWFNLHMPSLDSEWVRLELRPWKSHADLSQFPPMIIETYLDLRQLSPCEMVMLEDDHGDAWPVAEGGGSKKLEVVLERWLIEFDRSSSSSSSSVGGGVTSFSGTPEELPMIYKQAIVLIRVIYGIVRLLPAYKVKKRVGKLSNKNLALRNRFIDGKQPVNSKGRIGLSKSIVPHQMLLTESHMTQKEFSPIHTSLGTLRVSVAYRNHHKFNVQDHEERLSNHFMFSDSERTRDPQEIHTASRPSTAHDLKQEPDSPAVHVQSSKPHRGSFGQFREKYSVLPCTSQLPDKESSPPHNIMRKHGLVAISQQQQQQPPHPRPSIQPFKVGSIGSSSSPPYGTLTSVQTSAGGSSMERRISITSNRSGSNASLVALLRNPRGSTSSSNTPNTNTNPNPNLNPNPNPNVQSHQTLLPRSISSSSHGSHLPSEEHYPDSASNTPRFSSSFGSRQSRRFSNNSGRYAAGSNAETNTYFGTSVELASSSVPFSGLYADDDISSFVQMIDGTSELRLSNSNHDSKLATPNNESSTHFEALNRFQLLKSHYQHLSDSVNASLVLQHNTSRSILDEKITTRRSSHSTGSPAPSLPVGSYENSHMPSINSRLSKLGADKSQSPAENKTEYRVEYSNSPGQKIVSVPLTITTIAHASHGISPRCKKAVSGLATSPSAYDTTKPGITYEDVFEEDDEGVDYFASLRGSKHEPSQDHGLSFDNDDLLFEMTDTK